MRGSQSVQSHEPDTGGKTHAYPFLVISGVERPPVDTTEIMLVMFIEEV